MSKRSRWLTLFAVLTLFLFAVDGCTIVPIEEVEEREAQEAFDPVTYVDGIWESQVVPAIAENTADLPVVLQAVRRDLDAAAETYAISVSGAHNFPVHGEGTIMAVDTESRNGTAIVDLDGYDGPATVILQIGPLVRGDSVRDGTGFIEFGDFKEQTEFGQVSRELNKRVAEGVLGELDRESLVGKSVTFDGVFTIRTTNQTTIDLSEVTVTPVTFEVGG